METEREGERRGKREGGEREREEGEEDEDEEGFHTPEEEPGKENARPADPNSGRASEHILRE